MLNTVPPVSGGPKSPLIITDTINDDTIAAIIGFQKARYASSDGRVDPNGRTIADLKIYLDAAAEDDLRADPPEVFCDIRVTGGPCGPVMMERLRQVEADLRDQSPADTDFRSFYGIKSLDGHQGRKVPVPIGKAVDLNADANPYVVTRTIVGGQEKFGCERDGTPLPEAKCALIAAIYDRAVSWGHAGRVADIGVRRPGEATADVFARFRLVSSSLSAYLSFAMLPNGPSRITRQAIPAVESADYDSLLRAIPADGTLAERWQESEAKVVIKDFLDKFPVPNLPIPSADLITGWHAQILRDYELMRLPLVFGMPTPNPKMTRNPVYGFMDLPLAVADSMVRHGLQWGACDLGVGSSGDMMHFQSP